MKNIYEIKDGIIVRTDTGKKFPTMKSIVDQLNSCWRTSRYTLRKDNQGKEYIDWTGYSAKYYDLEELCELMNGAINDDLDVKWKKHLENTHNRIGHFTRPYRNGRFYSDHTKKKGFWLEDWLTGKVYYYHIIEHINAIVGLLNDYTSDGRFVTHDSKCGRVIEDTLTKEEYVLGDSKHLCFIRDFLNNHDYLRYGERKELPYKRQLM